MDRYFYFRTVSDIGNDDNIGDSVLVPVDNITGIYGRDDTNIEVYFETVAVTSAEGSAIANDFVQLTCASSKTNEIMQAICEAANNGPHEDGITVIADDVTGTYISEHITACSTITQTGLTPVEL